MFADIEAESFNLDPAAAEAAVTDRTAAIIPVHLFGRPADHAAIAEIAGRHGLRLLEDCAQAIGATVVGRDADSDRAPGGRPGRRRRVLVLPDEEPGRASATAGC